MEIALERLNNKSDGWYDDVLPDTRIAFSLRDTRNKKGGAMVGAISLMSAFGGQGAQLLLGSGNSESSEACELVQARHLGC